MKKPAHNISYTSSVAAVVSGGLLFGLTGNRCQSAPLRVASYGMQV